jgi:hypothetical protein
MGASGWALDVEVIAIADECGTLLDVDVDVDIVGTVVELDVLMERGDAEGKVPPIPLPAMPPVYPVTPLGRQRRLNSEADESSEDIFFLVLLSFFLCFFLLFNERVILLHRRCRQRRRHHLDLSFSCCFFLSSASLPRAPSDHIKLHHDHHSETPYSLLPTTAEKS